MSMGWGAGRKLREVLTNTENVLAVELVCAAQGCEQRRPLRPAPGTAAVLQAVRTVVPALDGDRPPGKDIEAAAGLIRNGRLVAPTAG